MQMVNQNRWMVFNFFVSLENLDWQRFQVKHLTIILKLIDFSLGGWNKLCSEISYLLCILSMLVYVLPKQSASKINVQYYELWWFQVGDNLFTFQQQVLTLDKELCGLFHIQGNQIQNSEKVNQNDSVPLVLRISVDSLSFSQIYKWVHQRTVSYPKH